MLIIRETLNQTSMNTIQEALTDIKKGKMVIVVDDEDRENEGDLVMAAEKVTKEDINFMAKEGRGLICTPISEETAKKLDLSLMVDKNTESKETNFTISADAKKNTTTGISASDRAKTIQTIINKTTKPEDLSRPGHIFPLIAKKGGVLVRAGHTEAAIDLAKLSGLFPAGVICEITNKDGEMARLTDLEKFAKKHNLKIITIKDLIDYRRHNEKLVRRKVESTLTTKYGKFKTIVYENDIDQSQHIALIKENVENQKNILVRVHSQCMTGEIFHSLHCDCGKQLDLALKKIAKKNQGVLLYMRQEGRGIGLVNKLKAYNLQNKGLDTVEANHKLGFQADLREYGIGAQILVDLGLSEIHLMTNNPKKIVGLEGYGLKITKRIPLETKPSLRNRRYLETKKRKMGHMLENV